MPRFRGSEPRSNNVALSEYNPGGSASASFVSRKKLFEAMVVGRWQELRRARSIPLLMFFVDLKMIYSSIDRERRWVGLTGLRVPEMMLTIIGQFHESMRARVRTDDGKHYEWHDVTQGLWHRCVLWPLHRTVFIAAQGYFSIR